MSEFFHLLFSQWWGILIVTVVAAGVWMLLSALLYRPFFKRFYDILLSGIAIAVLSPLLLLLIVLGAVKMHGNPFFVQRRPGKKEKIFRMLKFRTMTNKRDAEGVLLTDAERLTKYGKFLRATSLDELPELFNIFAGQMSIVGPRPLLVQYLPLYTQEQRLRHCVRPGLTGRAQVSGRNAITWGQKFANDIAYVQHITLWGDIAIVLRTVAKILKRDGISQAGQATMSYYTGNTPTEKEVKQINILILSAGRRVELVKAFRQALTTLNQAGKVIACDADSTAPALYFADAFCILPRVSDVSYLEALTALIKKESITQVVPTIDTELLVLAQHKATLEQETGAKIAVSDAECVSVCRDKTAFAVFVSRFGFAAPKTYTDKEILGGDAEFPLFIKPRDGSSSVQTFFIQNRKELDFFYGYVKNPIVQECVTGQEYTVDIFCDFDGKVITVVPRKRLTTRGGEVLKGETEKNAAVMSESKRLAEALKAIGHITVQGFLGADNIFRLIEVNPRFGGGAPMSFAAGANSPQNMIRLLRGDTLSYNEDFEGGALFSRFDDAVRIDAQSAENRRVLL